jgi:cellulose synthase/poly-beta-1,6-N-acetylglucosamine synthase-like glycosyltransferase
MHIFHWIAGTILALAWFSRIIDAALGMPSVGDVSRPEWNRNPVSPAGNPRVSIIVPARNEEATIELPLRTLLNLDYDNYEVIAVNDRSTDGTGEIMERIARESRRRPMESQTHHPLTEDTRKVGQPASVNLRVIHHTELPPGWLGKTHAMWTAASQATGDWLLFTDATGRVHDDRLLPDDVHVRPPALEGGRSQHERPHGRGRIQLGSSPRV